MLVNSVRLFSLPFSHPVTNSPLSHNVNHVSKRWEEEMDRPECSCLRGIGLSAASGLPTGLVTTAFSVVVAAVVAALIVVPSLAIVAYPVPGATKSPCTAAAGGFRYGLMGSVAPGSPSPLLPNTSEARAERVPSEYGHRTSFWERGSR